MKLPARSVSPQLTGILVMGLYGLYSWLQPVYTYELVSKVFDAHQYLAFYDFLAGNRPDFSVSFPFHARLLVPLLARLLNPSHAVPGFQWVNAMGVLLTVGLLLRYWSEQKLHPAAMVAGMLFGMLHWKGFARMYLPDPLTADVAGYALLSLWLIQMSRFTGKPLQWAGLALIAVIGTLQKEVFIVITAVTMGWWVWQQREQRLPARFVWPLALLGLTVITRIVASHYFPPEVDGWQQNSPVTVLRALWTYARRPQQVLLVPMRWLYTYGPFWVGLLLLKPKKDLVFWLGLTGLVLSTVGGGDTSRILMTFFPVIMTLMLRGISATPHPASMAALLFLVSLPMTRFSKLEPDMGLHPEQFHAWCVECWSIPEMLPWVLYILLVVWLLYRYHTTPIRLSK